MEIWDVLDENRNFTGRFALRDGSRMPPEDFHLVINVWIMNSRGEFLISRRSPEKDSFPGLWETVCGSVVSGETSLEGALREAREEVGLLLDPNRGELVLSEKCFSSWNNYFRDIWVFREEFQTETLTLQTEEVTEVMSASAGEILKRMKNGEFAPVFEYFEKIFLEK